MAYVPKRLYTGAPGTTITTLYTVPAATKVIVKQIIITNTTATNATISLYLVPNNAGAVGTAAVGNAIATAQIIPANSSVHLDLAQVLDAANDTVQALQGTASALTLVISGVTF